MILRRTFTQIFLITCHFSGVAMAGELARSAPRQPSAKTVAVTAPERATQTGKAAATAELPALPAGVEELKFSEFYQLPVGPRGLEITERLRALDGRRVRVLGHMVKEDLTPCNSCPITPPKKGKRALPAWMEFVVPGRMMLTEHPAMVSHAHYGLADDLPPQTVFVKVPDRFGELVPFTPGPMLLTGVLSIGNQPESDGRISVVRLTLDPPAPQTSMSTNQSVQPTK